MQRSRGWGRQREGLKTALLATPYATSERGGGAHVGFGQPATGTYLLMDAFLGGRGRRGLGVLWRQLAREDR